MNSESLPLRIYEPDPAEPVQSCFLPGTNTQYAWDSTSLGYLKTCPRLYYYKMIEGWSPRDESVHLRFGQEYHSALEEYDRALAQGESQANAVRHAVAGAIARTVGWDVDPGTRAGRYKNRSNLLALIIDYLDKFREDLAETFILEDGRPAVELSFRFELDWGPTAAHEPTPIEGNEDGHLGTFAAQPYLLCGHLDRVVSYAGSLFVMDRKTTTTTISDYFFAQFEPSNQMTLYTLATQVILGAPVKGVIIDAAQILLEKPNHFERGFTYRTQDQLDEWVSDLGFWLAQAESYASSNRWPMNDTACDKFGGCEFRGICSKSAHVRERFLASSFIKLPEDSRWNPLKPR